MRFRLVAIGNGSYRGISPQSAKGSHRNRLAIYSATSAIRALWISDVAVGCFRYRPVELVHSRSLASMSTQSQLVLLGNYTLLPDRQGTGGYCMARFSTIS